MTAILRYKFLILSCFILAVFSSCVSGPTEVEGSWMGLLPDKSTGIESHLLFSIAKSDTGYLAVMHDPDNLLLNIPVDMRLKATDIGFDIRSLNAKFEGTLTNDSLMEGIFTQFGEKTKIKLIKQKRITKFYRPQTPIYRSSDYNKEAVFIDNEKIDEERVALDGILSYPSEGNSFPAVILIADSGPLDKDGTIARHKPFFVLSDYLTKKGIAVLRYDKRGVGSSVGNFSKATTADLASDVEMAIDFLKNHNKIDPRRIGLIGHSEGGLIAFMLASKRKDIAYIVSMGAPGIPCKDIIKQQTENFYKVYNINDSIKKNNQELSKKIELIVKRAPTDTIMANMEHYVDQILPEWDKDNGLKRHRVRTALVNMSMPWSKFYLNLDPAKYLKNVNCPVFAINGGKDIQVVADVNLQKIVQQLNIGGNRKVTIKKYPELNHLFQRCNAGLVSEYAWIEETLSPEVLNDITNWVLKITNADLRRQKLSISSPSLILPR